MGNIKVKHAGRAVPVKVRILTMDPDWDDNDEQVMATLDELLGRGAGDPDMHGYPGERE